MSTPEAKFRINVREGIVELEGDIQFVDKHLEKFEEIFKSALKETISRKIDMNYQLEQSPTLLNREIDSSIPEIKHQTHILKHTPKTSINISPVPVDLKPNSDKIGLREFYSEKHPMNHYEKCAIFVYYISKFNNRDEIKYGEILSCYEEVNEKKPSVVDIIKNSIRYKGWLESGHDKFSIRITISGENFVKFDLPHK